VRPARRTWLALVAVGIGLVVLSSEGAYWLGWQLSGSGPRTGTCAVLVLGYPSGNDGSVDPVQTLRVGAAVDAFREHGCDRLVLSGGAIANPYVEADAMAAIARELGVPDDRIVLERAARDTWENVALSLPSLDGYDTLYVASDGLHAHRGRRYLCRQRPDLCARSFAVAGYHPFELLWWKVPASLWELRAFVRDTLSPR
jgi:vancomycin permeability regulator SanA